MIGKKVQVYFNLHKKCYSVRDKKTRLVIAHVNKICLEDVTFKVSEKGRARVLAEKRKNVHAIVEGTVLNLSGRFKSGMVNVTYNPYKYSSFINRANEDAIRASNECYMYIEDEKANIFAM